MIRFTTLLIITALKLDAAEAVLNLDAELPAAQTRYWSPGMNVCWHQLQDRHGISIKKPDPAGEITKLDKIKIEPKKTLPEASYFTFSGPATEATEALINQELTSRWPEDAEAIEVPKLEPGGIFSFAYFNHQLRYQKRFYRSRKMGLPFKIGAETKDCAFFGIKGELTASYPVKVLDYQEENRAFTLEIPGVEENQSLVLMMAPKIDNFAAALKKLTALRVNYQFLPTTADKPNYHRLHEEDDLRIPFTAFRTETEFQSQLSQAVLAKEGDKQPWRIAHAREKAQFTMDELGAKVVIQSELAGDPFGTLPDKPTPYPRKFYFDRPFFISMWMGDAASPYFIARIASHDDLEFFATEP